MQPKPIIELTSVFLCYSGYGARLDKIVDSKLKAIQWLKEETERMIDRGYSKEDSQTSLKFYEYKVQ